METTDIVTHSPHITRHTPTQIAFVYRHFPTLTAEDVKAASSAAGVRKGGDVGGHSAQGGAAGFLSMMEMLEVLMNKAVEEPEVCCCLALT